MEKPFHPLDSPDITVSYLENDKVFVYLLHKGDQFAMRLLQQISEYESNIIIWQQWCELKEKYQSVRPVTRPPKLRLPKLSETQLTALRWAVELNTLFTAREASLREVTLNTLVKEGLLDINLEASKLISETVYRVTIKGIQAYQTQRSQSYRSKPSFQSIKKITPLPPAIPEKKVNLSPSTIYKPLSDTEFEQLKYANAVRRFAVQNNSKPELDTLVERGFLNSKSTNYNNMVLYEITDSGRRAYVTEMKQRKR